MLAGRQSHLAPPDPALFVRSFKIRAAETARERHSANALVGRLYASRGYQSTALPDEETLNLKTFLASDHNEAIGTLSIRLDSGGGLLVDESFATEARRLRASGRRICEFTKLAMDRRARSPRLLASMFHVAYIYAHRINKVHDLLIEVNPRHVRYYESMLGFRIAGPQRHNARVGAPAVLLSLDLRHARDQIARFGGRPEMAATERSAYPYFFSHTDEEGIIARLMRSDEDVAHVREAARPAPPDVDANGGRLH